MARIIPIGPRTWRERLADAAAGRCPRCRSGAIFRSRLAMYAECPVCGLHFEREAGYFTGAMYVSYILAVPVMAVCAGVVLLLWPQLSFEWTAVAAALLFLPFVPFIFRYSRILWIHFDRTVDPN